MLVQRRRRWGNIGPTLDRCVVFAGRGLQDIVVFFLDVNSLVLKYFYDIEYDIVLK